ncbi:uncharacterized protein LOC120430428 [Culex pipiens pallens]|uniref:uncharacterized protein LOC120430428 n=1 Tax=Culex pipiens pallens TaxID=42434 RepID=UPI0022AADC96|nr:uncharacterized protein LOC120430428 [Culex pipiens pallens]
MSAEASRYRETNTIFRPHNSLLRPNRLDAGDCTCCDHVEVADHLHDSKPTRGDSEVAGDLHDDLHDSKRTSNGGHNRLLPFRPPEKDDINVTDTCQDGSPRGLKRLRNCSFLPVSVRLESLNKLWDVLCTTLVEIKSHKDYNPEDDPTYKKDRETLTEGYYRVKSLLLDKLKERQEVPCEPTHNDTIVGGTDHARLPQIKLPMFKGNIDEWLSFRDLFLSLIHWKSDLPDVEKSHYLKNCLDDKPKRIISGLSTTSVNYKLAWDRLQRYYNNHKVLMQRLVQSLFTLWYLKVLESLPPKTVNSRAVQHQQQQYVPKSMAKKVSYSTVQHAGYSCVACKDNHLLYQCSAFQRLVVSERDALLKTHSLCRNCFRTGHQAKNCTSKKPKVRQHPTWQTWQPRTHPCQAQQHKLQVLLATAVVIVEDDDGNRYPARALLDSGSESNFISERLAQLMKVTREKVDISVLGIGQSGTKVKHKIHATVRAPILADPAFFQSKKVDIVLGIECFFEFFETGRRIPLGDNLPALNESVFGWVVSGGLSVPCNSTQVKCNVSTSEKMETLMARFWSAEDVGLDDAFSPAERRCEENFQHTVQRLSDGRYSVSMPKVEGGISRLGESKEIALRRLHATERRLARDANLRKQYTDFMDEYLELGHMSKVEETTPTQVNRCFLPHHPVVKEASTTTKCRVVFDASCKTSSGVALNDVLLAGPVIQEDLRSIILRSRIKPVMLVSDVEKMFRQIMVHPEERPLQSILWRFSPDEEVGIYELKTVTYGTKPAPFLATRTLKQLATDDGPRFPLAARAVNQDTYMDDVITGAEDVQSAIELRKQLDEMMLRGGFKLRKWASNRQEVLAGIAEENLAISMEEINLDTDPGVKTLGLTWMPKTDTLKFQFNIPDLDKVPELTKRFILSTIALLFDPLGLLGPVIVTAKIFMQSLWTLLNPNGERLDWDEAVPEMVGEVWRRFHSQLALLNELRITRCVICPEVFKMELHFFSDASEKAFGSGAYLKSEDPKGRISVNLLTSKTKVAPLKSQAMPRLELRGGVLSAELYVQILQSLKIKIPTFFWVDAMCVLYWLQSPPSTWVTFVANRVAKIQALTEGCVWGHVPGVENPADFLSRGVMPADLIDLVPFWKPGWVKKTNEQRQPQPKIVTTEEAEEERRNTAASVAAATTAEFNVWFISHFSSYPDLVRRTAYWLRLKDLLRMPKEKRFKSDLLTVAELKEAEFALIRLVQKQVFADEWNKLTKGKPVANSSPLRWFNPYISDEQLIRVGGRLRHSLESEDTKHPIVLPARHQLTRLLFRHFHEKLLHAGPQLVLGVVRLRFWPLGGRSVIREVIHHCKECFRSKPVAVQQFMGELPSARVTTSRPFARTGVDYIGPLYVRPAPRRPAVKVYVALFICLCTKAVHLELVTDLSTERFIQALRRFVARRGICDDIYSDNGTNFVGARNKMAELLLLLKDRKHRDIVSKECSNQGIKWHFNPPSAPHFGGLWEAAVRSTKKLLLKTIGETPVTAEDLNTLLVQVEGCLNSRPLTPMSDDPNDLEPLTPAHCLVQSSLQTVPDADLSAIPMNRLDKFQTMQRMLQDFWTRWRREYLCQLQGRVKRWKPPIQIEVGKLVVIKDENSPPMRWKMGRIFEVHLGEDGVVRVVTLKTADGYLKRPVEKLCILPLPENPEATPRTDYPTNQDQTSQPKSDPVDAGGHQSCRRLGCTPAPQQKDWENFLDTIRDLDKIRVPRRLVTTNAAANELHGYADASKHAYGACVYVKSIISGSPAEQKLLCAKSKLVPKTV